MTTLSRISDIVIDCVLLAGTLYAAFLWLRLLWRWWTSTLMPRAVAVDPAATAVWDVLAEARRITEEGSTDGPAH
jgi:hypothetical protein